MRISLYKKGIAAAILGMFGTSAVSGRDASSGYGGAQRRR